MITYKLHKFNEKIVSVTKFIDNNFALAIPFDLANTDYQQYLKWLEEGNTPLPADNSPQENN